MKKRVSREMDMQNEIKKSFNTPKPLFERITTRREKERLRNVRHFSLFTMEEYLA